MPFPKKENKLRKLKICRQWYRHCERWIHRIMIGQTSIFKGKIFLKCIYPFLKDTPLTNLTITRQTIFPENNSVYIEWLTPIDWKTNQEEIIEQYRVQWGPLWTGEVERIVRTESEENITQVNLLVSDKTSLKCPVGEGGEFEFI